MVCNFFCGCSIAGIAMNIVVIGVEWTNRAKSALCTIAIAMFNSLGLILLPGLAFSIHNWRILQLVLFCPVLLVLGTYYCILPESVRWLMTQGRKEEVQKEVQKVARINGRRVPEDLLDNLEMEGKSRRGNMLDIFRKSYLRKRTLIMGFNWFVFVST
ncbi:hypothetical protein LDENG_00286460 [Lucifuga dentata]|nr:hypothetical protein LDENG_00286460 [Lucifuga dentata]